jgi:hypothetical protein
MTRSRSAGLVLSCLLLVASVFMPTSAAAQGQTIYGLVQGTNQIVRFPSAAPGTILETITISGVVSGETLRGIDFRPLTGELYGIATDAGGQVRVYSIDAKTGVATGFAPLLNPIIAGTQLGISFSPVVDRIRVVNSVDGNLRANPLNGALAGNDTSLTSTTTPQPIVDAVAYDNQFVGAPGTTLFALNRATNSLAYIGGANSVPSPNTGIVTDIGPLGVTITTASTTALDIDTNGTFFAAMRPSNGQESLYTINRTTGAATLVGLIGTGVLQLDSIAVAGPSLSLTPGNGTFTSTQRFDVVLLLDLLGRNVTGGAATFDAIDVTGPLASCLISGTSAGGVVSLRCPNLGGPVFGPGVHQLAITLNLSDGSQIKAAATWTIVAAIEP